MTNISGAAVAFP